MGLLETQPRKDFTELDFQKIIAGQEQDFRDIRFLESIFINNPAFSWKYLKFSNCEFVHGCYITDIHVEFEISFFNCKASEIIITNTQILCKRPLRHAILINNSEIHTVLIDHCNVKRNIEFQSKTEILHFQFEKNTIENGNLNIKGSIIGIIELDPNTISGDIRFENAKVNKRFRAQNVICSGFIFIKSTFLKNIWLWAGEAKNGITFNDSVFEEDFVIEAVKTNTDNDNLTIINSEFKRACSIIYRYKDKDNIILGGCRNIFIRDSKFGTGLLVNGGDIFNHFTINKIEINCSKLLTGEIIFNNLIVTNTKLQGANFDASLIFNNVKFQVLNLYYFSNYGKLQFVDVAPTKAVDETKLLMQNSYLGKAQFLNMDLKSFNIIRISNCDLTEISTSNVQWFELNQLNPHISDRKSYKSQLKDEGISQILHKRNREVFRQLKFAMEKQGDRIQYLVFKQYEMTCFKKELQLSESWNNGNRFIMFINQINDFGQNWWRPASLAIILAIIFSFLLIISQKISWHPAENLSDVKRTFEIFWQNVKVIPQLLNPAFSLADIFGKDVIIKGTTYWIGIFYRIIFAILIFQSITAFRKYSK